MKKLLSFIVMICSLSSNAQNYQITFTGTGASTTVEGVRVENLMAGTSVTLNGGDILNLTVTTGIFRNENIQSSDIMIYPNPMTDNSFMEFYPPASGNAVISVYEMTGRLLAQTSNYLESSRQVFLLSGIKTGSYLINISGRSYRLYGKLLSNSTKTSKISIKHISSFQSVGEQASDNESKGSQGTVNMAYTTGDRLKFTGISGNYSTVITDVPTQSKTITFNFMPCTDGDGIHYPIVEIGKQIWMAENLKTTKYINGNLIGTTVPATLDISGETNPKYQWAYNGNDDNVNVYGRLYTWFAVTDTRILCPTGWFLPTLNEWYVLEDLLGGYEIAGGKLKETGLTHWNSPNLQASNATGFTALPGGFRNMDGSFINLGNKGEWYSGSPYNSLKVWFWYTYYNGAGFSSTYDNKKSGLSVRCLKYTSPVVETFPVEIFTATTCTVSGKVASTGGATVNERGVYWGPSMNPSATGTKLQIGAGTGYYYAELTGLTANTTYYVMAYGVNSYGTSYGDEINFKTKPLTAPILTTNPAGSITQAQAFTGGDISEDGGSPVIARGVCWSELENPTISDSHTSDGTGTGTFTSFISGLKAGTKYFLRAYAQNSTGTGYGQPVSFTTLSGGPIVFNPALKYGTVTDVEGNVYKTIQIGTQLWMAENLRTKKYNDNTSIPYVSDNTAWENLTTPAYCWYNNDSSTYKTIYGALYNWYAVNTGKLCPAGWHVVDEDEYDALETYFGDMYKVGGKMKEEGLVHWVSPNSGATNETGFTGLPGGFRDVSSGGAFSSMGYKGYWWSTAVDYYGDVAGGVLDYYHSGLSTYSFHKTYGMSVRCIKD